MIPISKLLMCWTKWIELILFNEEICGKCFAAAGQAVHISLHCSPVWGDWLIGYEAPSIKTFQSLWTKGRHWSPLSVTPTISRETELSPRKRSEFPATFAFQRRWRYCLRAFCKLENFHWKFRTKLLPTWWAKAYRAFRWDLGIAWISFYFRIAW